jgi:hypothetical protein
MANDKEGRGSNGGPPERSEAQSKDAANKLNVTRRDGKPGLAHFVRCVAA